MPAALFAGDSNLKWSSTGVHWNWTILQLSILLDDQLLAAGGKLYA